ncbi:MAG: S8 family serine peptidase, partial [Saprospiraceae bacterium]|nr:S8 family serine peptidase [Saprospiraceae bacterium]
MTEVGAQRLNYKQGELILCFHPQAHQSSVIKKYATFQSKPTALKLGRCLSDQMNIWKATFDYLTIDDNLFMQALLEDPQIVVAQRNHFLKRRSIEPNDPLFSDQWQWINMGERGIADADVDAEEAWSLATGGVTRLGDTIVVAVIDVGVDYMHEDLADNIWVNHAEIPGNRIDDDENGYVDDVRGWNVLLENDDITPELFAGGVPQTHGTEILGMVGAVGNNGIGLVGINWNVKLMNVFFNTDLNEADMIAAYGYILAQRQIYNETNGEKGAFVVASNLSYGDEDLSPEDSPIWCAVYDSLGQQGIISCTAT